MRFTLPEARRSPRPSAPLRTAVLAVAVLALLASRATDMASPRGPARPSLAMHGLTRSPPADRSVAATFRR